MLKKHVIASILAIILTFYSGSQNFASATTQKIHNNKNSSAKAALCSGPFLTPWCGKIISTCTLEKRNISDPVSVASVPQKMTYELFAAPAQNTDGTDKKPLFSYSYSVAQATPTPTAAVPTPTVEVQAAVAYNTEVSPASSTGGLNPEVIFSMVNQIRTQNGLAPFAKDDRVCAIADARAPELYNEIYVNGNMHAGIARRQSEIPYWITENMISQNTEQQAVNWWMNSPIHRSAILGNHTHSCVSCSGNNCAMLFTSFIAKQ